jgi:general secretion pathway protein A
MYEGFYGLKADPFRLSADHRFCYNHRSYARAKAYVQYALYRAEGFVLVTGRPGTGKTTLVNDLLATLPNKEVVAGTLVSTQLEAEDLLLMAGHAFGLEFESPQKALVLQRLIEFFNEQHRKGLRTLLIIDEAQDLASSALEELRLLTNLQYKGAPLLQIALLGQDALRDIVRTPEMEQVHQRLIAAWQLEPLTPEETVGYVRHRLEHAGWHGDPAFEPGVMEIVYRFSKGVPRRINLICSRLLLHGFIGELHSIGVEDAETVTRDLHSEELALPDYETEEAPSSKGGTRTKRAPQAAQPDDQIWKGLDVGLFGPEVAGGAEQAATQSVEQATAKPPPVTAFRDRDRSTETGAAPAAPQSLSASPKPERREPRAAVAGLGAERRAEPPKTRPPVAPVHIVPEWDDFRQEERGQRPESPGWWTRVVSRSGLWAWIGALAVVWLVLLAVFLIRDEGDTPAKAAVQERLNDIVNTVQLSSAPGDAGSEPGDRIATPDPGVQTNRGGPIAERAPAPVAPVTERALGEDADPEIAVQDALPVSGKVFFRVNSTNVDPEFEPMLDEIAAALLEYEQAYAEIIGFTDRVGPLEYNMSLSRQRARSVANRLIMRGVPVERLMVEGQGPRDLEATAEGGRREERAVEITVRR